MKMQLHPIDYAIIVLYIIFLFLIGFIRRKRRFKGEDFLLSGRRLTLPVFVMTLVSTWYGGILGIGEFTYLHGLSNWFVMGFPYYIFALIYALFIAGRIRRNNAATIPELIRERYGKTASLISGFFVFMLTSPAAYLLISGIIISLITGIPVYLASLLIFIVVAIYLYRKGFESVVQSDILQFMIMFCGFIILFLVLVSRYPPAEFLNPQTLPEKHLTLTGKLPATYIISWFFIALWTLVDPGFHQRCAAAASPKIARNGILISIAFWILFDFLTVSTGLYARALLPDIQALYAYPLLASNVLPIGLLGLFMTGLLATVMSTLDSHIFISAQTIGYDVLYSLHKGDIRRNIRLGYLFSGIFAMLFIVLFPSVISIWYIVGTLVIPSLLIPVLSALFKRSVQPHIIRILMVGSFLLSLSWFLAGRIIGNYPLHIEPLYPGLLFSILCYAFGRLKRN
ncbi:MAG: sodium:solute symporter family protein [Candidatus Marinimicrobia bacterium]|jgi:SSS family solute:Na+ symporter|nr:sodium:solute symporter family protein [Candidatus Neomarinimicrobiota bacterium]MDD4960830.1 sodium:solute symporter family protein [Candidatus Neomarinimicrobiota bacterium]MDX9777434.1 sodium:solute symporter family protein [bacterium]